MLLYDSCAAPAAVCLCAPLHWLLSVLCGDIEDFHGLTQVRGSLFETSPV